MDLGTVADRVGRFHYTRLEDFANDVRLVWKNAFIFNDPASIYFKAARTLNDIFEKRLDEIEKECEQINPPTTDSMDRCLLLLADCRNNPMSEAFREPVDHVGLLLTDYTRIITTPMDLGTITKKMERGQYLSVEDFASDVRLVWQNAMTYNTKGSLYWTLAEILAQMFDRRYGMITRSQASDPGRPIPDRAGWPTFQAKKKFYDLCTKLTLADLNQMVAIVQSKCTNAVQQCGDKEVEVDVDELDMETFNKVHSWAQSRSKAQKTEPS